MPCLSRLKDFGRCRLGLLLLIAGPLLIACGGSSTGPAKDPDAQLLLLEPLGGETYHTGDSLHVRWKAQGKGVDEISSVTIFLSPDSGATWISLKSGSVGTEDAQWGDLAWKIPVTLSAKGIDFNLAARTHVLVKVQNYQNDSDPNQRAVTPKPFSIVL
ncbi:MAG: hypothetical protein JF616_20550 [Fibrobacteres bacterium]|nr:hypothetical protein [Fibrobacterota bacterium]